MHIQMWSPPQEWFHFLLFLGQPGRWTCKIMTQNSDRKDFLPLCSHVPLSMRTAVAKQTVSGARSRINLYCMLLIVQYSANKEEDKLTIRASAQQSGQPQRCNGPDAEHQHKHTHRSTQRVSENKVYPIEKA